MGSAALRNLSARGVSVLGIDRFDPPHARGSTHGDTRITRLAIGEGEHYSPLAKRSHEIWHEIERETGAALLTATGMLAISSERRTSQTHVADFFANTLAAAKRFGVDHEEWDAREIRDRFPMFRVADDEHGYYEPSAGFVRPEACVAAKLSLARKSGAAIQTGERVTGFEPSALGVRVPTDHAQYAADKIIISAGAWAPQLLGAAYSDILKIYRQVMFWFDVADDAPFRPERFPVFIWELQRKRQGIYGFPALEGHVKIATEQFAATVSPDAVSQVSAEERAAMYRDYVAPWISGVGPGCPRAATCLYTVTPDFGFVIDRLPDSERVILASPCSGHGFKHSPAIGEILADMAMDRQPQFDIAPFRLARFR